MKMAPLRYLISFVFLSAIATTANWLKMGSFWGDAARSVGEMYRASLGEQPYTDFSFPYPPASPLFFGTALRLLGPTFTNLQLLYSLCSALCVVCFWALARRIFPERAAASLSFAFLVFGATSGGALSLYSLQIYAPAMFFGVGGLALALCGILDLRRSGAAPQSLLLLGLGSLLAITGKSESAAGIGAAFGVYAIDSFLRLSVCWRSYARQIIAPAVVIFLPSALVFAWLFSRADHALLREGLGGYGLAMATCTWWPSGFALAGGIAAICTALTWTSWLLGALGRGALPRRRWFAAGLFFALPWAYYTWQFFEEITSQQSVRSGPLAIAYLFVTTNSVLLPFLWSACLVSTVLLGAWSVRRRPLTTRGFTILVLAIATAAISSRTLFGSLMSYVTQTSPVANIILFALLPLLLQSLAAWLGARMGSRLPFASLRSARSLGIVFLLGFSLIRIASYVVREWRLPYETIQTQAGKVLVSDGSSGPVYRYLEQNSQASDAVADLAYGGGLQFALQRRNPLFTTQFAVFRPSATVRRRDLEFLSARPARFVVSRPNLAVGYGTPAFACSFPAIEWRQPPFPRPEESFPVVDWIRERYAPVFTTPGFEVHVLRSP